MSRRLSWMLAVAALLGFAVLRVPLGWIAAVIALIAMRGATAEHTRLRNEQAVAIAQLELRLCELQRRWREVSLLFDMGALLHLGDRVEATEIVTSFGPRLFPLHDGAVYLADSRAEVAQLSVWWGTKPEVASLGMPDCWGMRDAHAHGCCHQEGDTAERLCVPMLAFGERIGVLTLQPVGAGEAASMEVVAAFADQIAGAMATMRMQETLKVRAVRDALTGLFNRRHFEETLIGELRRCRLMGGCVSVILIDIDRFKNINDTFGHAAGDALLQLFARLLQRFARETDVVCRWGGEEFVALLPDTPLAPAMDWANRLRLQVRALETRHGERMLDPISMSAGVATTPDDGTDPGPLLAAADQALYLAKNSGRDRVIASSTSAIGRDAA